MTTMCKSIHVVYRRFPAFNYRYGDKKEIAVCLKEQSVDVLRFQMT